jgi:hypothetical protein
MSSNSSSGDLRGAEGDEKCAFTKGKRERYKMMDRAT